MDELLRAARRQARRLGVQATPSFYLLRPRALTYSSISAAIRSALAR